MSVAIDSVVFATDPVFVPAIPSFLPPMLCSSAVGGGRVPPPDGVVGSSLTVSEPSVLGGGASMQSAVEAEPVAADAHSLFAFSIDGVPKRVDCCDIAGVAFERAQAVRAPSSWQHKANYCGYYWAATVRRHVWFESLYERSALMRIDRDRRVVGIAAQPMWIHWSSAPKRHAPDYFVRTVDGRASLIDVRPVELIDAAVTEVFDRTRDVCSRIGWDYAVVSDLGSVEQRNLRFLSGYRFARWQSEAAAERMRGCRGEAVALSEWVRRLHACRPDPLGAVFSALWWGELIVELSAPLTMSTMAKAA